jgi:hypothetical protein
MEYILTYIPTNVMSTNVTKAFTYYIVKSKLICQNCINLDVKALCTHANVM